MPGNAERYFWGVLEPRLIMWLTMNTIKKKIDVGIPSTGVTAEIEASANKLRRSMR